MSGAGSPKGESTHGYAGSLRITWLASKLENDLFKARPGPELRDINPFGPRANIGTMPKRILKFRCESSRPFIHCQITVATIEWVVENPERLPDSFLSRPLLPANFPRPTPRKPTQSSCAAKQPRYIPRGRWPAALADSQRHIRHQGSSEQHHIM
jgi:hypothetical protein